MFRDLEINVSLFLLGGCKIYMVRLYVFALRVYCRIFATGRKARTSCRPRDKTWHEGLKMGVYCTKSTLCETSNSVPRVCLVASSISRDPSLSLCTIHKISTREKRASTAQDIIATSGVSRFSIKTLRLLFVRETSYFSSEIVNVNWFYLENENSAVVAFALT